MKTMSISAHIASPNTAPGPQAAAPTMVKLYAQLRAQALLLTQCPFEADDLVQRVVERGLSHPGVFGPGNNARGWLTRVMRNLFFDDCRLRRVRRAAPIDEDLPVPSEPDEPPNVH